MSNYKTYKKLQQQNDISLANGQTFSLKANDDIMNKSLSQRKKLSKNNYLVENTKNLRNFFQDRIPRNNMFVGEK